MSFDQTTNSSGVYSSGNVAPGNYVIKVEAPNFKTTQVTAAVQVGQVASTNVKLELGASTTIVEVTAEQTHVNEEQATVQDVLTAQDIDELPVNGRNFLDLAALEPGVQIQDGSTFDPTKNGYSSLSFGGRFGRTARIEVDGVDISDETVGTTTQNIAQSSIQEFQVASSSLDLSTELTSSGTVNVVTKSGTNQIHGGAYYYGRSDQISARIAPTDLAFGRKQFGGDLGGPIIKNKLFFFGDVESEPTRRSRTRCNWPVFSRPCPAASARRSSSGSTWAAWMRISKPVGRYSAKFTYDQNESIRGSTRACISRSPTWTTLLRTRWERTSPRASSRTVFVSNT